ncbi:MAG: biotin--[acetyl-CoA-carboxylase] ligase [Bacteroidota bacterium]
MTITDSMMYRLHETDSTNFEAERLLATSRPAEGTVILADFQQSGKGLGTNRWESRRSENILMSLILYPDFLPTESQFMLNKVTSLAVAACTKKFLPRAGIRIKWPNDIYAGYGKIAGILIKNTISGIAFQHAIAGIGLNVNQQSFSAEVPNPVSMAGIAGKPFRRGEVIDVLLAEFNRHYQLLKKGDYQLLDRKYLDNLLNYSRPALYNDGGQNFNGIIRGVDEFGHLRLETDAGMKLYAMKEIKFVPE